MLYSTLPVKKKLFSTVTSNESELLSSPESAKLKRSSNFDSKPVQSILQADLPEPVLALSRSSNFNDQANPECSEDGQTADNVSSFFKNFEHKRPDFTPKTLFTRNPRPEKLSFKSKLLQQHETVPDDKNVEVSESLIVPSAQELTASDSNPSPQFSSFVDSPVTHTDVNITSIEKSSGFKYQDREDSGKKYESESRLSIHEDFCKPTKVRSSLIQYTPPLLQITRVNP